MLDDLFSHKIHASDLERWERQLVKLATIFERFDGQIFDRAKFDEELSILAPTARRSAFRDQYSIYTSILGVGQIVRIDGNWVCRISQTARTFLTGIEPNVGAFCRLQLALYQRPDGRGQKYQGSGQIESRSAPRTLRLIRDGYHVSPFRLILRIFRAKSLNLGVTEENVSVSPEEIFLAANEPGIRETPLPAMDVLRSTLGEIAAGKRERPEIGRKTFGFLAATGLVTVDDADHLVLTRYSTPELTATRDQRIEAIRDLPNFYYDFDKAKTPADLARILAAGDWANYFDAVRTLPQGTVAAIAGTDLEFTDERAPLPSQVSALPAQPRSAEFRSSRTPRPYTAPVRTADPEATRIKYERRNAYHDLILEKIEVKIRNLKLSPQFNDFIDLFTNVERIDRHMPGRFSVANSYLERQTLPYFPASQADSVTFVFEAKSSDDRIVLPQVRRAISQLYEYRYRYSAELKTHVILVIALQSDFHNFPWLRNYLLKDRCIAACWLDEKLERLLCPKECYPILGAFVDAVA